MVTGQLIQLMRILFASSCSVKDVAEIVFFAMPRLMLYAIPMAALVGVMLAFVRLNSDNELIACRGAGVGFLGLLPPVIVMLALLTLLGFFNTMYVLPLANSAFEMKLNMLGRASIPSLLKPGAFISDIPKLVFFFREVDHSDLSLKGIFIQDQRNPDGSVTISAESGRVLIPAESRSIILMLENGVLTRTAGDLKSAETLVFKNYDFTLSLNAVAGGREKSWKTRWEMSLSELREQANAFRNDRLMYLRMSVELHNRFALPFACLMLGLLGPPLGSLFGQRGRITGVTICIVVFLVYYLQLSACWTIVENTTISPFFAAWTPNLLSLLLAIYLWVKVHRETPIVPVRLARFIDVFCRKRFSKMRVTFLK